MTSVSTTVGKKSFRGNGVALRVNKSVWNAVLGCNLKNKDWSRFVPGQTIQDHSNSSLCPNHWCWGSWSWPVLWRSTRSSRNKTKKDVLFIIGDWNAKVGSQETPGVTGKFGLGVQNEAGQRLIGFCQEKTLLEESKHPLPTTQEKTVHMDITRWSISQSDCLYSLQPKKEKLYTVSKNKTGSWLWLRSWTPYCQIQTEIEESRGNH